MISDTPRFHFVPANPWVAVDCQRRDQIELAREPILRRRNIEFRAVGANGRTEDWLHDRIDGHGGSA
ncbi:MAG TPA: hypothetical protein VEE84_00320 [Burkholderiaceae bacterium]|nr:hypothetical protein [Burkholderiaceae bacterium]